MPDSINTLRCERHGSAQAAFVCRHLLCGSGLGFFHTDNGLYPDAWCAECDALMMQKGHWTRKAERFAGISIICHRCYLNIRRRIRVRRSES